MSRYTDRAHEQDEAIDARLESIKQNHILAPIDTPACPDWIKPRKVVNRRKRKDFSLNKSDRHMPPTKRSTLPAPDKP